VSTTLAVSSALSLGSLTVIAMTNYRLGYARVSTLEQDPASQLAALTEVGCQAGARQSPESTGLTWGFGVRDTR